MILIIIVIYIIGITILNMVKIKIIKFNQKNSIQHFC